MPGWGSALQTGASYVGKMGGYARNMHSAGMSRFGAAGMASIYGVAGGGLYGATLGRDYGQSRLGGFTTGAMGGALLGAGGYRYGKAGMRTNAAYSRMAASMGMRTPPLRYQAQAVGMGAVRQMKRDALRAKSYIGNSKVMANNGFNQIKSSMKAGYASV